MSTQPNRAEITGAEDRQDWPYASLFLFGYFGSGTPAGKRLRLHTWGALALLLVSSLVMGASSPDSPLRFAGAAGVPLAVGVVFWAYSRYLAALDELSRTMQLKACAFSYGAVMLIASGVAAFMTAAAPGSASIDPLWFFAILVLAEPLRGVVLVLYARKYR